MLEPLLLLKIVHVISASLLFGAGTAVGFFMLMAHRVRDPKAVAVVAGIAFAADLLFTVTAGLVQPITGAGMITLQERSPGEPWLVAAYVLFVLSALLWAPLVFIHRRMRRLAGAAAQAGEPLPAECDRLHRTGLMLGLPVLAMVLTIYVLMLAQPALWGSPG